MAKPSSVNNAISLNAGQQRDRRRSNLEGPGGDTELSDSSLGSGADVTNPSVLDQGAPTRSYTSRQEEDAGEPIAGGGYMGSTEMELERVRDRERQQRAVQGQFVGGGIGEGAGEGGEEAGGEGEGSTEEEEEESEETGFQGGGTDEDRALQFAQAQAQSERARDLAQARADIETEVSALREKYIGRQRKRNASNTLRGAFEGVELASAEGGVPLITLILELNLQMFNKYIGKSLIATVVGVKTHELDGVPGLDQSLAEDFVTITTDIVMCCIAPCCNPMCAPFVFMIIIFGLVASGLFKIPYLSDVIQLFH